MDNDTDIAGSTSLQYALSLPMINGDSRSTVVVDGRDVKRLHGPRLPKVRVQEVRASTMEPLLQRGSLVQYVREDYEGPGLYLIRLSKDERPFPAYVRKLSDDRWEIETTNREDPLHIVRENSRWENEWGDEVDFSIEGSCEQWSQTSVQLQ